MENNQKAFLMNQTNNQFNNNQPQQQIKNGFMTPNNRQAPTLNQNDIQSFGWDVGKIDPQKPPAHSTFVSPKLISETPKKKAIVVMRKRKNSANPTN